jgi:glutathione-specific gamma-glutamylcyclotransferase
MTKDKQRSHGLRVNRHAHSFLEEPALSMNWIFGYGSLIWRPAFPYTCCRKAAIRGWRRRFWQASPDHRGVPGAPGRVVTLVHEPLAECWGMAFALSHDDFDRVMSALDQREQNGYERRMVEVAFEDGSEAAAVTYIAGPDNPSFVGPAPLTEMAAQIASSHGPSGTNIEYFLKLADRLDAMGVRDDEIHDLRAALADLSVSVRS